MIKNVSNLRFLKKYISFYAFFQKASFAKSNFNISKKMLPIHSIPLKNYKDLNFSTYSKYNQNTIDETYDEFMKSGRDSEILVPWGKISLKEFGEKNGMPMIFVHGWLDNLNTWSLLIPYLLKLNKNLRIITFDEPGCGFSDNKPKGTYYEALGTVVEIRRIVNYFNFDKITLVGHSKGSFSCFIYACIFPKNVNHFISFDLFGPEICFQNELSDIIDKRIEIDNKFIVDKNNELFNNIYTEDSALDRFIESRRNFLLNKANAKILLKRGLKPFKNGVTFNRDIQWNFHSLQLFPKRETIIEFLNEMECNLQLFTASQTPFQVPDSFWDIYRMVYKKQCKIYEEHIIEGGHYIHMEKGQEIAEKLNNFLNKSKKI